MRGLVICWMLIGGLGFLIFPWYVTGDGFFSINWILEYSLEDYGSVLPQVFTNKKYWLLPLARYKYDTPCTYAVQFTVVDNKLDMCVTMRSNDLWFGFCNDQYCFSKLQEMVSERTGYEIGTYYHFAHNLHLYEDQLPEKNTLTSRAKQYG